MRKTLQIFLFFGFVVSAYFSYQHTMNFFQANGANEFQSGYDPYVYRLKYIGYELGSLAWNDIEKGALTVAKPRHVGIDFTGSIRYQPAKIIKEMEIAIASKVDGIVVQAIDDPEFNEVVNKATAEGIPVITIRTDAPESLRKTYVGSDHFAEGLAVGRELANVLKDGGKAGVVMMNRNFRYENKRLSGLKSALQKQTHIRLVEEAEFKRLEEITAAVRQLLNRHPDLQAIVLTSNEGEKEVVEEVRKRGRIDDCRIFVFSGQAETLTMWEQGLIHTAFIRQPQTIGEKSMELMLRWLDNRDLPLQDHYDVPFRLVSHGR